MAAVCANMQPQEELAALFSRNLTLNPMSQPPPASAAPAPAPAHEPQGERKIVYISQHYNHSAHAAKQESQPPRPASEPPQIERAVVERVLREHGVDPSNLSPAQLHLFTTVDTPEKLRLIELWCACPPTPASNNAALHCGTTTVQQEETLARMRFEQQQQQLIDQQLQQDFGGGGGMMQDDAEPETVMSLDGTPLTPVQASDGRWVASASYHYMEPYMASGYEELVRREYEESARRAYAEAVAPPPLKETAVPTAPGPTPAPAAPAAAGPGRPTFNPSHADPVYKASLGWGRQEAAMADQYGRLMAMREDEEML